MTVIIIVADPGQGFGMLLYELCTAGTKVNYRESGKQNSSRMSLERSSDGDHYQLINITGRKGKLEFLQKGASRKNNN